MKFHVITGLPRSGSTLFCNVLNQNPRFSASSTSILPALCASLVGGWSGSPDVIGGLQRDPKATKERLKRTMRAMMEAWYHQEATEDRVVFDKNRAWPLNYDLLGSTYPDAKMVVLVRDPRSVFASVEHHYRVNGLLEDRPRILEERLALSFSPEGVIGGPLIEARNLFHMGLGPEGNPKLTKVLWVRYEDFSESPANTMAKVYKFLDEPEFTHDFKNVVNTANDPDYLYQGFFPHDGNGKVQAQEAGSWSKWISEEVANTIVRENLWFMLRFGYVVPTPDPVENGGQDNGGQAQAPSRRKRGRASRR